MNRFLKKEWEDTEIPEEVYAGVRRRAWERLRQRQPQRTWTRPGIVALAAIAAMALLGVGLLWTPSTQAPAHTVVVAPPEVVPRPPANEVKEVAPARPVHRAVAQASSRRPLGGSVAARRDAATKAPERIAMNFVLPETGVRMIWIMDEGFRLKGGLE